jgi:ribosomal protein S1
MDEDKWNELKRRLKVGEEVEGVILYKMNFGYFIDLGDDALGLLEYLEIPGLTPEQRNSDETYPIGSRTKALIFRFNNWNHQVWLTKVPRREWKGIE